MGSRNDDDPQKTPPPPRRRGEVKRIATHEELVAHLPDVLRVANEDPAWSRLLLVNPLLVLEDLGLSLSEELQQHVRKTLGFPPGRGRQIAAARKKLRTELEKLCPGEKLSPPRTPRERAELLFDRLGVLPRGDKPKALTVEQLAEYRDAHPIARTLLELGRLERGAIVYHSRGVFEQCKRGRSHHPWINRLRFRVGESP